MARTQVTGPVHHYVVFPYNPNVGFYLGTSKIAPKVRIQRAYKKVYNDLTGQLLPFERIFQGEEGQIVSPLNRFNQAVYALMSAAPRFGGGSAPVFARGSHGPLDIGAKVRENDCFFTLILQFPFAGTVNSPTSEAMPPYYRFPYCVSENDDLDELGTAAEEVLLAITAQQGFFPANSGGALAAGTWLYSNDLGGVNLPTPD